MTGLIVPAAGSTATPVKGGAPSLLAIAGAPGVPSLAAFVDLLAGQPAATTPGVAPAGKRQADAAPGKTLPQADEDKGDPALDWLFAAMPGVTQPVPGAKAHPVGGAVPQAVAASAGAPAPIVSSDVLAISPDANPTSDVQAADQAPAEDADAGTSVPSVKAAQLASVAPDAIAKALGEATTDVSASGVASADAAPLVPGDPVSASPIPPVANPARPQGPVVATSTGHPTAENRPALDPGLRPSAIAANSFAKAPVPTAGQVAFRQPVADAPAPVRPGQPTLVQPAATQPAPNRLDQIVTAAQPAPTPATPDMAQQTDALASTKATADVTRVAVAPQPAAAATTQPAAVIMPALFALSRPAQERRDDSDAAPGAIAGASFLQPADATTLVAKSAEAQHQSLDMAQQDWPQKMIDRIDALRDAANANDTSIRLKPDALGRVDVAIRNHGDGAISVHFTAESTTTRAMIADAQPQLTAAAEARGIRLSGTSVDLAGSGQGNAEQQARQQFELRQNTSNHLAGGEEQTEAVSDGRIA